MIQNLHTFPFNFNRPKGLSARVNENMQNLNFPPHHVSQILNLKTKTLLHVFSVIYFVPNISYEGDGCPGRFLGFGQFRMEPPFSDIEMIISNNIPSITFIS